MESKSEQGYRYRANVARRKKDVISDLLNEPGQGMHSSTQTRALTDMVGVRYSDKQSEKKQETTEEQGKD